MFIAVSLSCSQYRRDDLVFDTYAWLAFSAFATTPLWSLGAANDGKDLIAFQHLLLKQCLRQALQLRSMLGKYGARLLVCLFKQSLHLCIHTLCAHLGVHAARFCHGRLTEERIIAIQVIGNHTRLLTHAPLGYHATRQLRCFFEVIFRARCDLTKGYLFSRTTS